MTEDIAGFIGDIERTKVDLGVIKTLFSEWYNERKRGALPRMSLLLARCNIGMA